MLGVMSYSNDPGCEHAWSVESRHATSDGLVHYVRCVRCTVRRIDLVAPGGVVPAGITRAIGAGATSHPTGSAAAPETRLSL